jgi:hypothetical protein
MPPQWWQSHGVTASLVNECEGYDCIGPTLVTRPGLPLVRSFNGPLRAAAILGGVGGIQLTTEGEDDMPTQTIELPDGTKITSPLGPIQAAQPPPPGAAAPPAEEEAPSDIEARVAALEEAVGQIIQMLGEMQGQQVAAIEAAMGPSAALPPE